jgi:formate hydrogenlyase subunit 4
MSGATAVAGVVELGGGVALSPLLPGLVQTAKGRLQGRRGPSSLQPYRELRRLWRRSRVTPEPRTLVYELAPPVVAGASLLALLLLPVGSSGASWGLGHDAIVLVGLLALARFAITAAAWDTGSGFALMGASRDLTFAVFVEALLVLVIVLLALPAASTDLVTISAVAADGGPWREPARWAAMAALALVVLAETGRQPIDNPDTHLELTMVHEGPLLEYAGRDQALLQWAAAARHWIMLVLVAELALPHPGPFAVQLAWLAGWLLALALALAAIETLQAKMRILRVPLLLGGGAALCLLGLVSSLLGASA